MEAAGVLPFVVSLLEEHADLVRDQGGPDLVAAGHELLAWLRVCAEQPRVMSQRASEQLLWHALCHVIYSKRGGVDMVPKYHAFIHLSARCFYSLFLILCLML